MATFRNTYFLKLKSGLAVCGYKVTSKKALICGISGQDGGLLAKLLVEKGYEVIGTSRDAELSRFDNLVILGIRDRVKCRSMTLNDFRSVLQVITEVRPDEIYNLAGQSSVGLSFMQPVETLESIAYATLNLLEAVRFINRPVRIYNAASGECFGESSAENPATEESPFRPRSPYGVAKATAFWEVANYREAYGLHACSGILFNHESPFRPTRFVTRKVVRAACRISAGSSERLSIGSTHIKRDWGWAEEYVDAMWRMLQDDVPRDYVIATGESHTLEAFIEAAFAEVGLDWKNHTDVDSSLFRATDIVDSFANPSRARELLGWRAQTRLPGLVSALVKAEVNALSSSGLRA